ncbi:MAG TPA: pyridoxal phosphate-dependent aminotransferase [Candidatus Desulfofervidus auxilii]|uniref:Pyridoxal phosphate-dependent aminotransferase n=1 Tax=Desulfofervidus auxilii TaxID=1621989 RepID=A0A7C0Y3B8_DESA2|nr:pyridoxal phosphate-dependent aminotransferase [Candidatus Desulfofervidus auxilii]
MVSNRIRNIPPSPTLTINAKAKAMQAAGIDVISLAAGEPDFDTPEHIKEAAIKAIKDGFTKYTAVGGIPELKEAVVNYIAKEYGLNYSPEEVLISCGGKHALYNLFQVILNPGDEVIIPAPYWVSYPPMILLAGGKPVIVETEEKKGFKLTPEILKSYLTPWTRAIIINSPSNPTGSVYTKKELEALAEVLIGKDIWIVSDDVYHKILLEDNLKWFSIANIDELKEKTFIINAVSKTYSMTGWRIGFLVGNKEIIRAATRLQGQSTSNPTSIAQKAALAALNGPQDFLKDWLNAFKERKKRLLSLLKEISKISCFEPKGAFYAFPNISAYLNKDISDSVKLAEYLLEKAHVGVVPGLAFGKEGYIRISFATSLELLEKAIERIKNSIEKLL